MSGLRWVKVPNLLSALRKSVPEAASRDETLDAVRDYIQKQDGQPDLISATEAATILGVKPPQVSRMRQSGRMPKGVLISGGTRKEPVEAYLREDIERLAKERAAEKVATPEEAKSDD